MLISRKLLTKRLVRTPNASTGLGIDVGQFHTKIVWLERTTAGQYRASAIKLPSAAELYNEPKINSAGDDLDRRSTSTNPFAVKKTRETTNETVWTAENLSHLGQRIGTALNNSKIRRAELNITVSMSVCDFRNVYLAKEGPEANWTVEQALAKSIGDTQKRCVAVLPNEDSKRKHRVFSIPESLSWGVANALEAQGLVPRRMDGLPWCLVGAYQTNAQSEAEQQNGIVLDWSYGSPTIVALTEGNVSYVRRLSHGSLQDIASQACQDMGLSAMQAARWLQVCLGANQDTANVDPGAIQETRSWAYHVCGELAADIREAVDFVRWRNQGQQTPKLCLVGGGAALPKLTEMLASNSEVGLSIWNLETATHSIGAEYATATSLALLGATNEE